MQSCTDGCYDGSRLHNHPVQETELGDVQEGRGEGQEEHGHYDSTVKRREKWECLRCAQQANALPNTESKWNAFDQKILDCQDLEKNIVQEAEPYQE
jgi:hypothetical protein